MFATSPAASSARPGSVQRPFFQGSEIAPAADVPMPMCALVFRVKEINAANGRTWCRKCCWSYYRRLNVWRRPWVPDGFEYRYQLSDIHVGRDGGRNHRRRERDEARAAFLHPTPRTRPPGHVLMAEIGAAVDKSIFETA